MNSRKKRANGRKNGYNTNGYSNGYTDYSMIGSGSPSTSFYPFYGSGTPFATHYSSSPPNGNNSFKYPLSPTQSRAVGNQSFRGMNNKTNYSNQSINSKANNQNFSRQLFTNGNGFQTSFAYQPNDRYHWVNKSMAKA